MSVYINFTATPAINGPIDLTSTITAPTGQPAGFGISSVFDGQGGYFLGLSAPSGVFSGSGAGTAGKSQPDAFQFTLIGGVASPVIFAATAAQTKIDRLCVINTNPATGGLATPWVQHYWLLKNCFITGFVTYTDNPTGSHQVTVIYGAAFLAEFDTPSGGVLGARHASGFDWATNKPWDGS